jgi:plastocyanin
MTRPLSRTTLLALAAVALAGCGDHSGPLNERGVWRYGISAADTRETSSTTGAMPATAAAPPTATPATLPTLAAPKEPPPTRTPEPAASGGAYKVIKVEHGGTIRALCRVDAVVALPQLLMFKDEEKCGHKKGHMMESERLIVDPATRGAGNCLVRIRRIDAGKDWLEPMRSEDRQLVFDQKGCRYIPHLAAIRADTQVVVLNSDKADHNIHAYFDKMNTGQLGDNKFNLGSAPGSKLESQDALLDRIGTYIIKCDIHPWMSGHVVVVSNPYYDITFAMDDPLTKKKAGEAVLTDVPPGEYEVEMWHEGTVETVHGTSSVTYSPPFVETRTVIVAPDAEVLVEFTFKPR